MNGPETSWEGAKLGDPEPECQNVGPGTQGAALILELRRLQAALEHNLHERPPAPRRPAASPQRAAPVAQIEYQPPARRSSTRTDGLMTIGARWLVGLLQFVFARPGALNAHAGAHGGVPAAALGTRMDHALSSELRTGLRVLIAAVVVAGGWGTFVPLGGAIVTPGVIVVESRIKKVQHPSGGIVSQINVKDGSRVAAGDLLVRLDETQARANNQMLAKQLEQVQMRIARLIAERDGAADITLPHHLTDREMQEDISDLPSEEAK